jgi:hypothetical protein
LPAFREGLAKFAKLSLQFLKFAVEAFQLGVSALQRFQPLSGLVTKCDNFFDRAPVLSLKRLEEVQALLEFCESVGIQIDPVGVAGQFDLQFPD